MSLRFCVNILPISHSFPFRKLSPFPPLHSHSFSEETEMFRDVDVILFEGDVLRLVPPMEWLYHRHPVSTICGCFCLLILLPWATSSRRSEGFSLFHSYSIISTIYSNTCLQGLLLRPQGWPTGRNGDRRGLVGVSWSLLRMPLCYLLVALRAANPRCHCGYLVHAKPAT
jgi:hypothetical protein